MIKKLLLSAAFLTTALFSGLNYSIYAQAVNTVELETLNPEQVKNIIRVNSENELPKDGTTYTLVYSKQHCKLPDEPEKTSEVTTITTEKGVPEVLDKPSIEIPTTASTSIETTATTSTVVPNSVVSTTNSSTTETKNTTTASINEASQKKTTESTPQTTTLTTVLKAQVKQSLPQTGTQKSVAMVLTAGVLVALAFLMIKYHKKKVWMVLLITASVTSLYNLRNVMAQNETKVTTIPVTTFVPTKEYCLVGYIIIPNTSEPTTTTTSTEPTTTTAGTSTETTTTTATTTTSTEPTTTTAGTSTEATTTTATTTTSTEPTRDTNIAEPIFESSEASSDNTELTTEASANGK